MEGLALCLLSELSLDQSIDQLVANRLQLMRTLRSLTSQGKAVLTVLHDLSLAMTFADELAVIHRGTLLIKDTPEAVFASGALDEAFGVRWARAETADGMLYYATESKTARES